jgi:hypothetical protein
MPYLSTSAIPASLTEAAPTNGTAANCGRGPGAARRAHAINVGVGVSPCMLRITEAAPGLRIQRPMAFPA